MSSAKRYRCFRTPDMPRDNSKLKNLGESGGYSALYETGEVQILVISGEVGGKQQSWGMVRGAKWRIPPN